MRPFLAGLLASTLGAAGCGGNVVVDVLGAAGSTGTTTGEGGAGTTTTTTGTTTTTTTTSTSTTKPICVETHDGFRAALQMFDGTAFDCFTSPPPGPMEIKLQGRVMDGDDSNIVFDTCGPNADCPGPISNRLVIESPGFHVSVPTGTFVEVRMDLEPTFEGCIHRVMVTNLPSWVGLPNPVVKDQRLWLAGSDGYQDAMSGAPFLLEAVPLSCGFTDTDCAAHEDYQWRFASTFVADPDGTFVPMGATVGWFNDGAAYQIRNLRSYSSGFCDDYWNWAYWITETPPPK